MQIQLMCGWENPRWQPCQSILHWILRRYSIALDYHREATSSAIIKIFDQIRSTSHKLKKQTNKNKTKQKITKTNKQNKPKPITCLKPTWIIRTKMLQTWGHCPFMHCLTIADPSALINLHLLWPGNLYSPFT